MRLDQFPEICLGTAQFGLDYGLTNKFGKIKSNQIKDILSFALRSKIKYLDTAQDYGQAEKIIGENVNSKSDFKIISKINTNIKYDNSNKFIDTLENNLFISLRKLSLNHLYGLLIHDVKTLSHSSYPFIKEWLISLKDRKIVKNIGISIYEKNDLDYIDLDKLDIVQLPLSIYDQRLLNDGTIQNLKKSGFKIFVRSIFLQGLILQNHKLWPTFLSPEFRFHHKSFEQYIENKKLSNLKASLGFLGICKNIDAFLIGITSKKELLEIYKDWENIKNGIIKIELPYDSYSWDNIYDIDPRKWIRG